jgi:hypothetical protein
VAQYHDERWQFVPEAEKGGEAPRYRIAFSELGASLQASASQLSASRTQ